MKDIVIYGAGGFGKETALLLKQINAAKPSWHVIGFADDGIAAGEKVAGLSVLGGLSFLQNFHTEIAVVIAIAEPSIRHTIYQQLQLPRLSFPSIIHPGVFVDEETTVGEGSIICAGVQMTNHIKLGRFSLVNLLCTLGHDCQIGDFSSLMPSVNISGCVTIGQRCFVGVGASVLQGLTIGHDCRIGAGAVVTKSFSDNKKIIGMPARSV
ncbi:MAG: acetyltransferase [Bacteroidetes bacterium]|nr:acetyltransferase [Bacteroidota bacterium]